MNKSINKLQPDENSDIDLKVKEAQIEQIYQQTWGGLAGIMIIMVSVCIALWEVIPHWKLLLWSGSLIFLSLIRSSVIISFKNIAPKGKQIIKWARFHETGAWASGILWALPSLFLWPENSPVHQIVWPVCIVSLAASAVAKYCIWAPTYLPYLLLTVVPVSLRLFAEGGLVYSILGMLGLVFTAILAQTGKLMHDASLKALVLSIRNETLNTFLSEEKAKEEKLNEQLQLRNNELELAFRDIKQLSGLLPICASCKKIRNDKGYWEQIENYIKDHSEIQFSHGICPDCAKKLYPDFFRNFRD